MSSACVGFAIEDIFTDNVNFEACARSHDKVERSRQRRLSFTRLGLATWVNRADRPEDRRTG
jgi:hypothetical protein